MNNNVFVVDMGSPKKKKFGWCSTKNQDGSDNIDEFLKAISGETYFAVGIEAPLFLPINASKELTKSRNFDDGHPWSATAGACCGIITLPFLMKCFETVKDADIEVTTDHRYWKNKGKNCLLVWEAFISGNIVSGHQEQVGNPNPHINDAIIGFHLFTSSDEGFRTIDDQGKNYLNLPLALATFIGIRIHHSRNFLIVRGSKSNQLKTSERGKK